MEHITVDQLAARTGVVVDVREPDEFAAGRVPGALNIPRHRLTARLGEIPTGSPVAVICQSGRRSAQGTEVLAAAGIDAVTVDGGTAAWAQAGRPLEH
ncbi:MAG: rhodanese-like domain-containing protein [Acidobacteria bacterium]|nr:rhodanese-like domain-containing protein [Acidobacteriota bacterium]